MNLWHIGRKTTTYKKIAINEPKIDSQVDNPALKEDVTKLDSVTKKSDTWWQNNRHDSLTKNELSIYKMVDTIVNMPLTRLYKNSITFLTTGVKDVGPIQLGPYYYLFSRNPVEGLRFRLTIGTPLTLTNLKLTTYAAYGLKDKRWKYGFNGLWIMKRVPRLTLNGHIIHDVNGTTDNTIQSAGLDNIFSAFFRKPHIHWKLAFIDEQQLQLFKEYKYGFSHKFSVRHKQYTPYHPLPHEGIFTDVNNQPSLSGSIFEAGVELRFAYRERFLEGRYVRRRLANKYPALNVAYYTGIKGILGSNYQYQKIRFSVTETANIPPLGVLSYSLFAGKYFGTLPYSFLEIHQGNEFMYYNRNAFEMMNNYEFISDQYAGFFLEHNIGGGLLNRVPLLKKLHIRQFWTAKGIIGTLSEDNKALNFNKGY
ncbi:MAG: hypothetical protein EBX41_10515, partial [Chitinophagia bacterium]|nr:hypothetical protein [Chitinophagia bacterium]